MCGMQRMTSRRQREVKAKGNMAAELVLALTTKDT